MLYKVTVFPPNATSFSFNASRYEPYSNGTISFETDEGNKVFTISMPIQIDQLKETVSKVEPLVAGSRASANIAESNSE